MIMQNPNRVKSPTARVVASERSPSSEAISSFAWGLLWRHRTLPRNDTRAPPPPPESESTELEKGSCLLASAVPFYLSPTNTRNSGKS